MEKHNSLWLVKICFLDHVATTGGVSEPINCTVYGLLFAEDKKAYYVAHWLAGKEIDANTDSHTILKSTVKSIKRLLKEKL